MISQNKKTSEEVRAIKDYVIILRIKLGDVDAWGLLVEKYYDTIFNYCRRRFFGNTILAEDLTQDVFLKVISNIDSYKFSGKFFNYLFTVAVNACNNYSKKQKFEESEFDESYADHSNLNSKNKEVADSKGDEIQNALDALPEYQREAIILRFYYDMKVKEVAMVTGTSVATAQSRIQQGLDKLKRLLKREDFYFE